MQSSLDFYLWVIFQLDFSFRCHCHLVEYHTMHLTIQFIQAKYLGLKSRLFCIFFRVIWHNLIICIILQVLSLVVASLDLTHVSPFAPFKHWHYCMTSGSVLPLELEDHASTQFAIPPHCRWTSFYTNHVQQGREPLEKPVSQLIPFCGTRFWAV